MENGAPVEPPDGATYVPTAYRPGEVALHRLAWVLPPNAAPEETAGTDAQKYLSTLPRIATSCLHPDAGLLGVVYGDSPVATEAHPPRLCAVSVVVSGVVTIVDPFFKDKITAGKRLHAAASAPGGFRLTDTPVPPEGHRHVGIVLEVGSRNDARILLTL